MTSDTERRLRGRVGAAHRSVLTQDVHERLTSLIMDGELPAGARVNIYAVARLLDVSQTPVREVLARLESEGLVTKEPLRGYSVTPPLTAAQVADLYRLRLLLEPWAAEQAAERFAAGARERIETELASVPEAPAGTSYRDYREIQAHDARFHDLVTELSGSESVRAALRHTHAHLRLFRIDYPGRDTGARTLAEHGRVGRAIVAGRPDDAGVAMRAHLKAARDRFLDSLGTPR